MAVMYFLRMGEAIKESTVCGHHIYKEVWRPVCGQEFAVRKHTVEERVEDGEWRWQTIYEKRCHV